MEPRSLSPQTNSQKREHWLTSCLPAEQWFTRVPLDQAQKTCLCFSTWAVVLTPTRWRDLLGDSLAGFGVVPWRLEMKGFILCASWRLPLMGCFEVRGRAMGFPKLYFQVLPAEPTWTKGQDRGWQGFVTRHSRLLLLLYLVSVVKTSWPLHNVCRKCRIITPHRESLYTAERGHFVCSFGQTASEYVNNKFLGETAVTLWVMVYNSQDRFYIPACDIYLGRWPL